MLVREVIVCRSEVRRRSFVVQFVFVWISIPSRVVETGSVDCFKMGFDVVLDSKLLDTINNNIHVYWPRSVTNINLKLDKHTIGNNKKKVLLRHREAELIYSIGTLV